MNAFSFLKGMVKDASLAANRRVDEAADIIARGHNVMEGNRAVLVGYTPAEAAAIRDKAFWNGASDSVRGNLDNRISKSKIGEKIKANKDGNYSNFQRARSLMYHQDGSLAAGRIAGIAGVTGGVGIAGLAATKGGYDTVFGKD